MRREEDTEGGIGGRRRMQYVQKEGGIAGEKEE